MHYFSLKTQRDQRMNGMSFEAFLDNKMQGMFSSEYSVHSDPKLKSLFLH
jgi:hypothetical protein